MIPFSYLEKEGLISFEKPVVLSSMEVEGTVASLSYSLDGERFFEEKIHQEGTRLDLKNLVCVFLRVEGAKPVSFEEGEGYIGIPDEEFTSLFQTKKDGWAEMVYSPSTSSIIAMMNLIVFEPYAFSATRL